MELREATRSWIRPFVLFVCCLAVPDEGTATLLPQALILQNLLAKKSTV
jgi:hypothetical protein